MNMPRVLIVDDNLMNLELVSFLLEADGIEVVSVPDAHSALRDIRSFQPELILMDIQLPDIDGLTLTRQLKADPSTRHMAVVAFTAYAMKGDEARMLEAGCDGYIAKPIEIGSFTKTIRNHLAKNRSHT
ncbi:response regulator [Aquabacterium sp. NJ1]|uniref:response regulator n=1 Tax=Aquabacterium sp. NJ1 TaxID=1538295 RepID=UPI001F1C86F1|nr:response regulator [Aquabacterium sp. NJ1]